jgi:hypothetical protein
LSNELNMAIQAIDKKIEILTEARRIALLPGMAHLLSLLLEAREAPQEKSGRPRKAAAEPRKLSPEARKRIAAAQRKRWANYRADRVNGAAGSATA